jgi:hypothetical protein
VKRYILGLIGFAALSGSPLLAQTPTAVQTVTHRQTVQGCDAGCCQATHTACVPECYTKVKKTTVFSSGCEPLCLCYYSACKLFHRSDCEDGHCETPITRKYLMKRVVTCEESATRCVPSEAPGCATTGFLRGHAMAAPAFLPAGPTSTSVAVTPAGLGEPTPFVGLKMPQAAVSPR